MCSWGSTSSIISVARVPDPCTSIVLTALLALSLTASTLRAQVPVDSVAPLPHRIRPDVALLRPGQFVYQMTLERDVSSIIIGTRTVTVAQSTYAGSPAWLMVESRVGQGIDAADSLYTTVDSLRPIHWGSVQGPSRLAAEFRGDTVYGATTVPGGRRSVITSVPAGTFVSSAMLETVLRLLPLNVAWEDSASTLSITPASNALVPTRLSVIGEDRVQVPAGTFDCWVVAIHAGDQGRGLYWVSKRDPILVRSALDVPTLGGAQLVSALTRISR